VCDGVEIGIPEHKKGEVGAWAIQKGFSYSLCDQTSQDRIVPGQAFFEATPGN